MGLSNGLSRELRSCCDQEDVRFGCLQPHDLGVNGWFGDLVGCHGDDLFEPGFEHVPQAGQIITAKVIVLGQHGNLRCSQFFNSRASRRKGACIPINAFGNWEISPNFDAPDARKSWGTFFACRYFAMALFCAVPSEENIRATSSLSTRRRACSTVLGGTYPSSSEISLILRPFMPPLSLTKLKYAISALPRAL